MINFLFKGLLRDRSRSLFPIIIITVIVAIIIFFNGFLKGLYNAMFLNTALVSSGHIKVVTSAYHKESQLLPNDLALLEVNTLIEDLESQHNTYFWTPRITFAGLLDVPDENGETLTQSPVFALGLDFLSDNSRQLEIWSLDKKIIKGKLPNTHNEILLSEKLSDRLNVKEGQKITFIGSTMEGAFTTYNYTVSGIFNLRMGPIDNQMMLVDIKGAQFALDMENAASEILGYENSLVFDDDQFNINESDIDNVLDTVRLSNLKNDHIKGLETIIADTTFKASEGETQRFGIARALLKKKEILILDEITSSLDEINENNIMNIIKNLKGSTTIIMISHKNSSLKFCDQVYTLQNKKLSEFQLSN